MENIAYKPHGHFGMIKNLIKHLKIVESIFFIKYFRDYKSNLTRLGTFDTVEDFWNYYCYLRRPSSLDKDTNFYLFRNQDYPAWETYPEGGCWILKVKKNPGVISKLWQDLLFAAIGEQFGTPDVVGVMMAIRSREDMVSIWNKDNFKSSYEKFKIAYIIIIYIVKN